MRTWKVEGFIGPTTASSLQVGARFSNGISISGLVEAIDLFPASGAVRVTFKASGKGGDVARTMWFVGGHGEAVE